MRRMSGLPNPIADVSDAETIEAGIQAHKSADSEGLVVLCARMCRLRLTEISIK
jgi:hypothetical protein